MNIRTKYAVTVLALGAALAASGGASAQAAGDWTVKVGINRITPKVKSGDISAPALPGTKAAVGADTQPTLSITRMLTDNFSAELDLGTPYKHKLYGAGALEGTGQLGTSQVLPPTLFAQYRFFQPDAMVRPYVGLGLTYAYFRRETGSGQLTAVLNTGGAPATFSLDNQWAASFQLGGTVAINQRWYADLVLVKTKLKTTAHYSTRQTNDIALDPLAVSIGIGYRF
ncbi:MAG: OmpW family outer membrane protein [Pseudomonadota bacterium]